jgi:hypothetical protein
MLFVEPSRQAEIRQLDVSIFINENVVRFYISVMTRMMLVLETRNVTMLTDE